MNKKRGVKRRGRPVGRPSKNVPLLRIQHPRRTVLALVLVYKGRKEGVGYWWCVVLVRRSTGPFNIDIEDGGLVGSFRGKWERGKMSL